MTVRELRNWLADQPGDAEIQPGDNSDLYIHDDQLGVIAHIELE